ncbi:hypothetical protein TNCV_2696041 [Trichonephila clavipes]|nr:hypothetical protein TNCV_2696041 [Trichonephila clavipes]
MVNDSDCGAVGIGSNPGEGIDVCKCIVPLRQGGTLNSRRAASPLVRRAVLSRNAQAREDQRSTSKKWSPNLIICTEENSKLLHKNWRFFQFLLLCCQVIYSQFGFAIHQNDHQARRRFVEWAQDEIVVVPDFHKRILFSDEAHFWLNGYVNKQNCRIWSEASPQVYVETPLHPEKLTVWCALWAGGILLQKR